MLDVGDGFPIEVPNYQLNAPRSAMFDNSLDQYKLSVNLYDLIVQINGNLADEMFLNNKNYRLRQFFETKRRQLIKMKNKVDERLGLRSKLQ